jgi:DNA-binding MarR family transcriptional regulator
MHKGNEMPLLEEELRALTLLDEIEQNPDITQAGLAARLGVAVGTVNWHIKRLVSKGYLKVKRLERKKLRYIITPEGLALRTRLAMDYVQHSFDLYRKIRARVKEQLIEVRQAGFDRVRILGEGDVAEICLLTCLEQGIAVVNDPQTPTLRIEGYKIRLEMETWKERGTSS